MLKGTQTQPGAFSVSFAYEYPTKPSSKKAKADEEINNVKRSGFAWTVVFAAFISAAYGVYEYQYEHMPPPLSAEQAGKSGFSELEAMNHVKALSELGPHPVGSDALYHALQYVLAAAEKINETKHPNVDVEVELFHAKSGANRGVFKGKTLIYSDLNHIILKIKPNIQQKYASEAEENAILLNCHIDTVFSSEGAGDSSSNVAVMLELARGVSQNSGGFKNSIVFFFNTGEEEGLDGSHSFITQHPWNKTVRVAVDLASMGIGGKSTIFQSGPNPWTTENFATAAKYPSGQITAQDIFSSGVISSATDFQVYKEVGGLSGLEFAFTDNGAVYHTKNDKLELLKPGSLQHLGENMLSFLLQTASSNSLPNGNALKEEGKNVQETAVFFDILGMYMVVYSQRFANVLYSSVILQSLLIWTASLVMGGYPAAVSLALTCLSAILMLVFSISFSVVVAIILPLISSSPVPYVASPWLVIGLFAAPAFLGALTGQHFGYIILKAYLANQYSNRKQLSPVNEADLINLEAERCLFKAGLLQWFILLALGNYYRIGSTFVALVWLASPAFAYGFLEATLTPARLPKPLKLATLLMGLAVPVLVSAGNFFRLANMIVAIMVRFDSNPGGSPEWLGNVILAVFIAVVLCLTLVYLLSYVHLSGAKSPIALASCVLFGLSLILVLCGTIPPFSEETARPVNVVYVVDASGKQEPSSYIALYSTTPGKLTKEAEHVNEGFVCGKDNVVDFITLSMEYGCLAYDDDTKVGWSYSDIPTFHVNSNIRGNENERVTQVSVDTKGSVRWSLAINAQEIQDFTFREENSDELVPRDEKTSLGGWYIIQFSGGKNSQSKFDLTLHWKNSTPSADIVFNRQRDEQQPLIKLRTDFDRLTPKTERVLSKLPAWCSLFGMSTSPQTFSFLNSLPVGDNIKDI